jgi:formylglycine-generating enzyme required for sulfatase activity
MSRSPALWSTLFVVLLTIGATAYAQTIEQQRAGVVRVTAVSNGVPKTGTGFIVRLDADAAYILTAAHVVEGDPRPRVEFYTRQNMLVEADAVRLEGGDPRGLALIIVRGKDKLASSLSALPLADAASLTGGESVVAIGFPQGGGPWAVVPANVVSRIGRDITLAGAIDEGNSGGPVLANGAVVAVVVQETGKFGVAVPVAIAKMTIEGWGVQPIASQPKPATPAAAAQPGATSAPRPVAAAAVPAPGQPPQDCPGCPEMVVVPAGSFTMGSPDSEKGRSSNEGPVHQVTIPAALAVSKYEVTRGQFARFVRATGRDMSGSCWFWDDKEKKAREDPAKSWLDPGFAQSDEHPVVCVSFADATAYVEWLSKQTGKGYRLLSEAEWEYAARASTTTARYWGEGEGQACAYANVADRQAKSKHPEWTTFDCDDGHAETAPVGQYKPNAFGLHDMLGNVWEWTQDCWNEGYQGAPTAGTAWLSGDCSVRVARGASWGYGPDFVRSASRSGDGSADRFDVLGFRVARTLP